MYFVVSLGILLLSFFISKFKVEFRKILIIVNVIVAIIYMYWRISAIPDGDVISRVLGICLYIAELIGISQFFIFQFLFLKSHKVEQRVLKDYGGNLPTIDILICTYNESKDLLEKTIVAALNTDYNDSLKTVNVCDDGRRAEIKELCKKYNVNWIIRDNNEGAKAGNINNALNFLSGELFAVLDADMIVDKSFLKKTVGYFVDNDVAFVQTPQCYYNRDMYQYNLKKNIPNEQDFFMRDVQDARASVNAVLHVGTNAVFRRQYVDEIGGYPTCSITEDMAVGMKLQAKGYRSIFINEVLALGLSATTYSDLVSQRDRWCRGNLQVFKHFNPIFEKGLTLSQKIAYLDGVLYWFSSLQKMIFILAPIIFLMTKTKLLDAEFRSVISVFVPFFVGQMLIFKTLSPKTRSIKWSHYYEVAMAPHISMSVLKEIFALKVKFNVTPKNISSDKGYFQFKVALPHMVLFVLSVCSLFMGFYNLFWLPHDNIGAYIINIVWCLYNVVAIVVSLIVSYQKPIKSTEDEIVSTNGFVKCSVFDNKNGTNIECNIEDISNKAMRVKTKQNIGYIKKGDKLRLVLDKGVSVKTTVVRNYNNELVVKYDDLEKENGRILMELYISNMKPYYYVNKKPVYVKRKSKEIKIGQKRTVS